LGFRRRRGFTMPPRGRGSAVPRTPNPSPGIEVPICPKRWIARSSDLRSAVVGADRAIAAKQAARGATGGRPAGAQLTSSGCCAPVRRGGRCPGSADCQRSATTALCAGAKPEFGTASWCACISMPPTQKSHPDRCMGRSRGGLTTKIYALTDARPGAGTGADTRTGRRLSGCRQPARASA
jgi:hypothetical protein